MKYFVASSIEVPAMKIISLFFILLLYCRNIQSEEIILPQTPGYFTIERWKETFPGCKYQDGIKEKHAQIVIKNEKPWLRVNYIPGQIGPEKNGVGWKYPIGQFSEVELKYKVRFSENFDFVKGGKLPGLSGGPESVTGGNKANGYNGFSARLMWRKSGQGEAYVYHVDQQDNYGDSFIFPENFQFPINQEIAIRLQLTLNKPSQKDGCLKVWITNNNQAEQKVLERNQLNFRASPKILIDSLQFETFFGGNSKDWSPQKHSYAEFTDIEYSGK